MMLRSLAEGLVWGLRWLGPARWDVATIFYWFVGPAWLLLLVVALVSDGSPLERWRGRWLDWSGRAYWIWLSVVMLMTRVPMMMGREFDPDESLLLGTAQILHRGGVLYRDADPETSGPLNVLGLLAGPVFGMPLNYAWIRLYAALLWVAIVLVMAMAVRGWVPEWLRRAGILVCGFLPAALQESTMAHASSELVATLFVAMSVLVLMRAAGGRAEGWGWAVFGGIVWAWSPFSKPQGLPIEAMLGLLLVVTVWRQHARKWRWLGLWAISGSAALALMLGSIAVSGGWTEFVESYIIRNIAWANMIPRPMSFYLSWGWQRSFFQTDTVMFYRLLCGLLVIAAGSWLWRRQRVWPWVSAAAALVFVAGMYAAARPGTGYPHHLVMMFAPLFLLTLMLLREVEARSPVLALGWCAVAMTILWSNRVSAGEHMVLSKEWYRPKQAHVEVGSVIFRYADAGEGLGHWGWTPIFHIDRRMPAATRFITSAIQLNAGPPLLDYFLWRYREDVEGSKPPVFIDSSRSSLFRFPSPEFRVTRRDPLMKTWLEAHYTLLPEVDETQVWVRNDRYRERQQMMQR